ncbi:MAG: 3-hydroxyacyl-ACP dehydratase FabZ [Gemmatimonadota bacterium]
MDINRILECLPHRYPFLLVDRVLELEPGRRVVGLKNVTMNEPFFAGHFPGHPIMPGVLIVEAMAQAGGILAMSEVEDPARKVVYFMSLDGVKFRRPVTPGDQLRLEVEVIRLKGPICRMKGLGKVEDELVAEAQMMARIVDR